MTTNQIKEKLKSKGYDFLNKSAKNSHEPLGS